MRRRLGGLPVAELDQLYLHNAARVPSFAVHWPAVHPRPDAGGQFHNHRASLAAGQCLGRVSEQNYLVARIEHLPGVFVHHHHVAS